MPGPTLRLLCLAGLCLMTPATALGQAAGPGAPVEANPGGSIIQQFRPQRPRDTDQQFLDAVSNETAVIALATPVRAPDRMVIQGSIIQAALETAINSDLPGTIRAIVSRDVRSYDGRRVLIPKGSRLIGEYRSDLKLAQERILIVWNRVVTPDGISVHIGGAGIDRLGRSGASGQVDTHFIERFGSAALISLIGAIPVFAAAELDNEAAGDVAENVGEDFRETTSGALQQYLTIQPTVHVHQGAVVNVIIRRDLLFPATGFR